MTAILKPAPLTALSRAGSPKPIERETLAKIATRLLREVILSGELAEGEQLRQDALAAQYGISRIPLREALRQLEAEGLVSFIAHRGAVVSALSLDEIEELFAIRALIEPELVRRAIPRLSEEDLTRAAEILAQQADAFKQESRVRMWGELNWRFHATLYAAADQPQSMAIIEKVNRNIDRYLRIQLTLSRGTSRAVDEHQAILDACRAKDVRAAARLTRNHILAASRILIQCLKTERAIAATRAGI